MAPALIVLLLFLLPAGAAAGKKHGPKPGLPLAASPVSTLIGDNVGAVKLVVRPVRRAKLGPIRIALKNGQGKVLSRKRIKSPSKSAEVISMPISRPLHPGPYQVHMVGKKLKGGGPLRADRTIVFAEGGGGAAPVESGALVQQATIDWSDGKFEGRDTSGFVAPGIGYGEVVCNPNTQWVRFFGSAGGREVAMMTWTYKNWGTYQEKALREANYTSGSGFDFNEGLNKFTPPEHTSTGSFDGVISDRGPFGNNGGAELAPVTTLSLNWEWDFTNSATSRCHVEAVFRTETPQTTLPLARSLQTFWRGEASAPANGFRSIDFPGLGTVSIRCEPGEPRQIRVESASGATVITREESGDRSIGEGSGPVVADLPNNGMVVIEMSSGERLIFASRWKMNDPDSSQNYCAIAGQVASAGFPGSQLTM